MNLNNICESERRSLNRLKKALLIPNYFKTIGIVIFLAALVSVLFIGTFIDGGETVKLVLKKIMLVALLLFALAKEKIEDELVEKLRSQAYSAAFICGVIYTLVQPLVNLAVAALIKPEKAIYADLGDFVILWFMLFVYICLFNLLKRTS